MSIELKEKFVCDICEREFPSKRPLGNHVSWCSGNRKKAVRKPQTKEAKRNISKSLTGRKLSEEHIQTLRDSHSSFPKETRECLGSGCTNTYTCAVTSGQRWCSIACGNKYRPTRIPRVERTCAFSECANTFVCRVTSTKKYCSNACCNAYRRQFIDHSSIERNKKISNTISLQYLNGTRQCRNGYGEGWVYLEAIDKKVYCRSSYEKDFLKRIDCKEILKDVVSEPLRVAYQDKEGIDRYYIPDFSIELLDSSKYLVEVKPEYQLTDANVKLKTAAILELSDEKNIHFVFATEKSIYCTDNGSTTEFLQVIVEATVAILKRMMIQSEPC